MPFFGRRFHGDGAYDTLQLNPLATYRAQDADVDDSGGNVSEWRDRGPFDNHLVLGTSPTWDATGWNGTSGAVEFTGSPFLTANAATTILTALNGSNVPFSVLLRMQFTSIADQVICAWDHTSGNAQSIIRIDNTGTGRMRYQRQGDTGAPAVATSGQDIGTGRVSLSYVFTGSRAQLYFGPDLNLDTPLTTDDCTFNRFRLGTGPGAIDALSGAIKDLTILSFAASESQVQQYHAAMVAQFP